MKLLLPFVLLLAACTTTGTATAPQTFTQILAAAEAADDAVIVTATSALKAGTITSAQAKKILVITDGINSALALANTTYQAGNLSSATSELATVTSILTTVQACLTDVAAKQSIDNCLVPIATPPSTP
jgi:predicted GTPase